MQFCVVKLCVKLKTNFVMRLAMQHQLFGQKQHKNQVKLDEIKELLDLLFLTF